jgi:transcriptional regulator with XRE-family HTH domain
MKTMYKGHETEQAIMSFAKEYRQSKGYTLEQIGDQFVTSKTNIHRIEVCKHKLTLNSLNRYLRAMGLCFEIHIKEVKL